MIISLYRHCEATKWPWQSSFLNTWIATLARNDIFRYGFFAILSFLLLAFSHLSHAESELNFAKSTQNPLAVNPETRYFTLPIVNYANFGYGTGKQTQDILDLKPVTPVTFTQSLDLIFRTIIPIMHQPQPKAGYINGLGDINPTAFISPKKYSSLIWGFGPTFILPTATNTALGAGKLSIGPELVLITMPDVWTLAILTSNVWSMAGHPSRPSVNQFSFQYFITYNFAHGWYLTTQPTITSNWQAEPGQKWVIPFGGGAGRAFHIGPQAVNFSIQAYFNTVRPSTSPYWTLQGNFELLFPDNRTT